MRNTCTGSVNTSVWEWQNPTKIVRDSMEREHVPFRRLFSACFYAQSFHWRWSGEWEKKGDVGKCKRKKTKSIFVCLLSECCNSNGMNHKFGHFSFERQKSFVWFRFRGRRFTRCCKTIRSKNASNVQSELNWKSKFTKKILQTFREKNSLQNIWIGCNLSTDGSVDFSCGSLLFPSSFP